MKRTQTEPTTSTAEPTSLYRYYDRHGMLLYVGITKRGSARNLEHNASKDWWRHVASQEVEHFPSRESAHAAEVRAIERSWPPFNTQHHPAPTATRQAYEQFAYFFTAFPDAQTAMRSSRVRSLQVVRHDASTGRVVFAAKVSDYHLFRALPEKKGTRIFEGSRLVGHVQSVQLKGPFAVLPGRLYRDVDLTQGVTAKIKQRTYKGVFFELAGVRIGSAA